MTKEINGLAQSWDFAKSVYINPPYNREIKNRRFNELNELKRELEDSLKEDAKRELTFV
jgi:hypothetical protein